MESMSFIVGVKLSAALAGVTPALEIRTTLAATDMHERASNSRIGLFTMPPSNMCGINGTSGYQRPLAPINSASSPTVTTPMLVAIPAPLYSGQLMFMEPVNPSVVAPSMLSPGANETGLNLCRLRHPQQGELTIDFIAIATRRAHGCRYKLCFRKLGGIQKSFRIRF